MVRTMQIKIFNSDRKLIICGDLLESHLIQTKKDQFELEITLFNTFCPLEEPDYSTVTEDCSHYP